jgi:hypothetical protein
MRVLEREAPSLVVIKLCIWNFFFKEYVFEILKSLLVLTIHPFFISLELIFLG